MKVAFTFLKQQPTEKTVDRDITENYYFVILNQLCSTEMPYWARKYVTMFMRAAH